MKIKKDWWLANSIIYFCSGVLSVFFIVQEPDLAVKLTGIVLLSGTEFLIGLGLLKRSKLIFWITFVLVIFSSLSTLNKIQTGLVQIYSLMSLSALIKISFIIMLWQQIKREEKKK
ncbi:MAG: hypothetical protein AAB705_02170 [Patescibacteria group bacterium]